MDRYIDPITASREALLAGRECKVPTRHGTNKKVGRTAGVKVATHNARRWHICPACFPGE